MVAARSRKNWSAIAASRECGADHFFDKASEFHKVREVLLQIDASAA